MDFYKNLLINQKFKLIKLYQQILHKKMIKQIKTYFNSDVNRCNLM